MTGVILLAVLFCTVFYYYCIMPMKHWKKRGIKQSSPAWLFGDTIKAILRKETFPQLIIRLYKQHPNER